MEKLVEIMLNEGLDEDTIVNVISNLMNEEDENVEYSNSLSESCFNDIINLVEELICERDWDNKVSKKEWEKSRGNESSNKDYELEHNQNVIKELKKDADPNKDSITVPNAVDVIALSNRKLLGRDKNPISSWTSSEWLKRKDNKESNPYRKIMSQRGSTKDSRLVNNDPLHVTHSIIRGRLADDDE